MKKKSILRILPVINILILLTLVFAGISYFQNIYLFIVEMVVAVVACAFAVIRMVTLQRDVHNYFTQLTQEIQEIGSDSLDRFALPLMVTQDGDEIVWYNEAFRNQVLKGEDLNGEEPGFILGDAAQETLKTEKQVTVHYQGRAYSVYEYKTNVHGVAQRLYFFFDATRYEQIAQMYRQSRICVMFIQLDGIDFVLKNALESEKAEIIGAVERQIETMTKGINGFFQKLSNDKYVLILQQQALDGMVQAKFPVLQSVRDLDFGERGTTSLSIGVGVGSDSIAESVNMANAALDMAVSRGGDQAVIKNGDAYTFYGGIKQATQISSRVRTRVVANTLSKLVAGSENVLIMGHRFSDMDSFGAALALCRAVQALKKPAKIVIDTEKTLAKPLVRLATGYDIYKDALLAPEKAAGEMGKRTLLIIVDTHRPSFVESPELYRQAQTVVVIDHHRKTVDSIENALLFYHDPSASSTCEMVTEMLQYMGNNLVGKLEADALLAGIMLDTRNFVLRTGTRTFEASAYLRSRGANPVQVKKLFSDSMETYIARSQIVAHARIHGDCAVAFCQEQGEIARIASSQAADELLTISGVNASFVLYVCGDEINISARSLGVVNVQVIMEQLGGGGHQTMAAAQLEHETPEGAVQRLVQAIEQARERSGVKSS